MIKRTNEEILAKMEQMWPEAKCRVQWNQDDSVSISAAKMYSAPQIAFAQLMELAEFFGTKNIGAPEHYGSRGCETCDYGSSYKWDLLILPETSK